MTNATETKPEVSQLETARANLTELETKLSAAQSTLGEVESRFLEMIKTAGSGMDVSAQLALADERNKAAGEVEVFTKQVNSVKSRIDALTKTERLTALEKPVDSFRSAVGAAFGKSDLAKLMADAGAGDVMTLTINVSRAKNEEGQETVSWTVSSAFRAGQAIKQASSDGASPTRGRGTAKEIIADGKSYSARDYVEAYWDAGKVAGYKTARATFADVPPNEYSKIAPRMAELLGHVYQDKPEAASAETPAA